jgi:hypothetical protein
MRRYLCPSSNPLDNGPHEHAEPVFNRGRISVAAKLWRPLADDIDHVLIKSWWDWVIVGPTKAPYLIHEHVIG